MPAGDDCGQEELRATDIAHGRVHRLHGLLERGVVAAGSAQGGEGDAAEPARLRATPSRVGDRDPGAVAVLDVVEPVAADVVAGQDAPGELVAAYANDPRRDQALLKLRGGVDVLTTAGGVDHVGVTVGQLERRGAELRHLPQTGLGVP